MEKRKIFIIFGTRPEAIKLAPVVKESIYYRDRFDTVVCVTGQHREMLDQVLGLFDLKPDYDLNLMAPDQDLADLTAKILCKITAVLSEEKPHLVMVQGDTTSSFASALAAYYLKIPVAHVEAGLRTKRKFSPFPEEMNRKLTGVLTDLHFAPTKIAKENLIKENIEDESIFVTGNTVIDALNWVANKFNNGFDKKWIEFFSGRHSISLGAGKKTVLVTGHRRESFGDGFERICCALLSLAKDNPSAQFVYPVHLNANVKGPVYSMLGGTDNIYLIPPLDYEPFIFLMKESYLILTDSGGVQEEGPTFGKPILVMRDTSERPEGIEAGAARLVGTNIERIIEETQKLMNNKVEYDVMSNVKNPYGDGMSSRRIFKIIEEHFERVYCE